MIHVNQWDRPYNRDCYILVYFIQLVESTIIHVHLFIHTFLFHLKTFSLNVIIKIYIIYSADKKILTIFSTNLYLRIYLASRNHCSFIQQKKEPTQSIKKKVLACIVDSLIHKGAYPRENNYNSQYVRRRKNGVMVSLRHPCSSYRNEVVQSKSPNGGGKIYHEIHDKKKNIAIMNTQNRSVIKNKIIKCVQIK